ncbi:coiled-coil domain-containing protein 174 [Galleria mellonella]|uniref:Coiled-coil domain-containing protein 174 n=1 Tax=Galleria mellonella TaxID=7137 RepID=A0A6J3CFD9_GALME|nr:coiled-coil domain-containing protein 174 [Galleria mellonella]
MMNENSKKIIFNKSMLLSLKAELLKKQEEVLEQKQLPQKKLENFKPPLSKNKHVDNCSEKSKTSFKDKLKAVDTEELEACRKAKLALERKTELYEHLSDNAGNSQLAGRFLVDFKTKKQEQVVENIENSHDEDEATLLIQDDQNEWTEFTDCLGRTRKCLKSDLELYKKRDKDLLRAVNKDAPYTEVEDEDKHDASTNTKEKPFLVQKTNDYLLSLRQKWEEKERDLLAKDKDIHYQDLLFDEARIHGVGYYSFSTDETERRNQMEELMKRRQETLKAQQDAEEVRKKRDALMAARVAAARARQRARAGLPPEDPKENEEDFTTRLMEFLTQQKNEADAKAKEEEKKIREEQEKERQKLREAYIREWDLGKEGVDDKVKKFREMSQEEYVDQQRDKRIEEFAPPQGSNSNKSNYSFDSTGRMVNLETNTPIEKSWSDVRPRVKTPPPPTIGDVTEQKGLYFSTVKKPEHSVKYRNFIKAQEEVTQIVNELDEHNDGEDQTSRPGKRTHETKHTEIAPPPTYDYYGPTPKHLKYEKPFDSDIREAYAQGSKSLETKTSNRQLPKHYDFTFD